MHGAESLERNTVAPRIRAVLRVAVVIEESRETEFTSSCELLNVAAASRAVMIRITGFIETLDMSFLVDRELNIR